MKKEFRLPKKWYMKPVVSDEQCQLIKEWMHTTQTGGTHWEQDFGKTYYLHYHGEDNQTNGYYAPLEGYKEITFKQFEKYILKIKEENHNYLIPIFKKYNIL